MKGRFKRMTVFLFGAIAAVAILGTLLRPREPVYQGKKVSQWINELPVGQRLVGLGFVDRETPAREAIRTIGTNAVPGLARAMNRRESFLAKLWIKLWSRWPFLQRHYPRPVYPIEIRREAAWTLREIVSKYPKAPFEGVVPALTKTLQDPDSDLRITALAILGIIATKQHSQSALSALIEALDSPDGGVRSQAAWKLSEGDQTQSLALPALRRMLSDRSAAVRINAALAVYRIGRQTNEAVAILIGALGATSPTDRGNAAYHLSLIGPAAKAAIPALEERLEDAEPYPRDWATAALQKIDPENHKEQKPSLQTLIERLTNGDENTRTSAAFGLSEMGVDAKPAVPSLVEALRTRSVENLWAVAQALWIIDPEQAPIIISTMTNYLADQSAMNRHMAALVLAKIGPKASETVPTLLSGLADQNPRLRQYCAYGLLRIGASEEAARRRAIEILVDGLLPKRDIHDRRNSARFLGEVGPAAKGAVPALADVVKENDDAELAKLARQALSKIVPDAAAKTGEQ